MNLKFCFFKVLFLFFILFSNLYAEEGNNYIVGPGDTLDIKVYDHPDLSLKISVSGNGYLRFPLIGEFLVAGKTPSQISDEIEIKLSDGYLVNPQVSVFISENRSQKATILGEVEKPGLYELTGKTTLLEFISTAEGLTPEAGRFIYITRTFEGEGLEGQRDVIKIDLKALVEDGDTSQNIFLSNGDSIFVPEMKKIYVTGEIKKPAAYRFEENLSVIKAITNAGGLTDKAAPKNVRIIRTVNGEKKIVEKVSMDEKVLPDDVIVVPESFF
ncbi:MAG: SLBB domain-containing protein [Desulforegulaceae bacterium]|nr:SLBB domain-containing protein [Desulforegulaceae bacterium]